MAVHDPEFLRRAQEARSRIVELGPAEVDQLRLRGAALIDVRSPAEFADGHLEGALSLAAEPWIPHRPLHCRRAQRHPRGLQS
ncbi:MAG: rhodanese-like domain-containing protein [Cyanobium sp.]